MSSNTGELEIAHVLFMDLVGYSTLPMEQGTARVRELQEVVRQTGTYQAAKKADDLIVLPTGDGMALAFFGNPTSAVHCAVELSRALRDYSQLLLRMGVHSGPVYRVEDINEAHNVAGGGINTAQRVMDCGEAGHILLSAGVVDVLGQVGGWEEYTKNLGEFTVKHGQKLLLFNLCGDDFGNPEPPQAHRTSEPVPAERAGVQPEASRPSTQEQTGEHHGQGGDTAVHLSGAGLNTIPEATLRTRWSASSIGALAVLLVVVVSAAWFFRDSGDRSSSTAPLLRPLTTYPSLERHPTLSPDGSHVAFAWNGEDGGGFDIYARPVDGTALMRLTSHPGIDASPAWSPDGRWIAFHRLRAGIFVVGPLGGPERQILDRGGQPAWAADSESLFYADRTGPEGLLAIFRTSLDGGAPQQVTFPPAGEWGDSSPAVSPDGRTLAFTRGGPGPTALFVKPLAGGPPRQILADEAPIRGLVWTPDSRSVILGWTRNGTKRLWRVGTDSADPRPEPLAGGGDDAGDPDVAAPRPGSQGRLVYARTSAASDIWVTDLRAPPGDERRILSSKPIIQSTRQDWHPEFSPTGEWIVFTSDRTAIAQIWRCSTNGENCAQLTSQQRYAYSPHWSPDGRRIAFTTNDGSASTMNVSVMNADGSALVALTQIDGSLSDARSWSTDGRWVYCMSNRTGDYEIWKQPLDAGAALQVTRGGGIRAQEGADGSVYFVKPAPGLTNPMELWKLTRDLVEPTIAVDRVAGYNGWEVHETGIYFLEPPSERGELYAFRFYDFETGRTRLLGRLSKAPSTGRTGFSVSPDGGSALTVHNAPGISDLMLVEDFE